MPEATYELKTPLGYQDGGSNVEAKVVVLTAPAGKEKKYSMRLKAGVMRASQMAAKQMEGRVRAEPKKGDEDLKLDGSALVQMFYMVEGFEYEEYYDNFGKLLCTGVCVFEGSDKTMTPAYLETLTQDDLEGILGVYLENFILPSLGLT